MCNYYEAGSPNATCRAQNAMISGSRETRNYCMGEGSFECSAIKSQQKREEQKQKFFAARKKEAEQKKLAKINRAKEINKGE